MTEESEDKISKREIRQLILTVLFFMALFGAIIASVIITCHKFITTEESVTEKVSFVSHHETSAIVFFGVDFSLEMCRIILLQPGSLDIEPMFHNGSDCISSQLNIDLDVKDIDFLRKNKLQGDSDFDTYMNLYVQHNHKENISTEGASLRVMLVEGPAMWEMKETVYVKVRSPKGEFLHPMYLLMDYDTTRDTFDLMSIALNSSDPLTALNLFNDLISSEVTSFRLVSSQTATMFSMSDAVILHEKQKVTMRKIEAEPTYMCSFASSGGMVDCNKIARQKSASGETLSNYNCASEEEKTKTTYSESLFRWADGHLSEKVSTKERNIWAIFGALVTMILTLDRLLATIKRYKATNAAKHIKKVKKKKRQNRSQKAETANLADNQEENGNLIGDNNQSPNKMTKCPERGFSDTEVHNESPIHDDPQSSQSDGRNSQSNNSVKHSTTV